MANKQSAALSGSTERAEQNAWLTNLAQQGYRTAVCHGADEAIAEIGAYLRGEREKEEVRLCDAPD